METTIDLYTIGFNRKSAAEFFGALERAGVRRLVDVRLNNTSQLAGFTKKDDLRFFVERVLQAEYIHLPELAPTPEILDAYKKQKGDWAVYEQAFLELLASRGVEKTVAPAVLHQGCLLCSEETAEHCHRRLVAEYLQRCWGNLRVTHLE